ncbi:MAG: hypothetical protein JW888_06430 [Pirellulales bacterium]|nr:hypothetical protein [Pirellulales bacterium]
MATAGKAPQKTNIASHEAPVTKEQLRRDRINLALVVVIFGALIALMIWLATLGPPPGDFQHIYPTLP